MNETLIPAAIEPVTSMLGNLMGFLSAALGGLFGLYLILVILKWRESFALRKTMKQVREELKTLNARVEQIEVVAGHMDNKKGKRANSSNANSKKHPSKQQNTTKKNKDKKKTTGQKISQLFRRKQS